MGKMFPDIVHVYIEFFRSNVLLRENEDIAIDIDVLWHTKAKTVSNFERGGGCGGGGVFLGGLSHYPVANYEP